jgi:hypothetical protein
MADNKVYDSLSSRRSAAIRRTAAAGLKMSIKAWNAAMAQIHCGDAEEAEAEPAASFSNLITLASRSFATLSAGPFLYEASRLSIVS